MLVVALLASIVGAPTAARARACATVRLLEASRRGELVAPFASSQARPPSVGHIDSERFPIRVHWPDESAASRAETLLASVEDAWQRQVEGQGYPAPLPDDGEGGDARFDVYLGLAAPAAALTLAHDDVDDDDGRHASYAHMVVEASLDDQELRPVVEHELAHAVQFGIDLSESLMFFEASAVAQEYFLDRSVGFSTRSWASDFEDFQAWPSAAPFTNGIDLYFIVGGDSLYEYGAALFLLYLEHEHGDGDGTLLRQLWEGSVQPDATEENEPDWLDALAHDLDIDVTDVVLDFATWRALVSSWAVEGDGLPGAEALAGTALLGTRRLLASALDGAPLLIGETEQPQQLGCFTFETTALASLGMPLEVSVESAAVGGADEPPRSLGMAWLVGAPDERRVSRGIHGGRGQKLTLGLTLQRGETGLVAVCDLDEADADELPEPRPVRVRVRRTDVPMTDAGLPATTGDAGPLVIPPLGSTCSCQAVPAPSSRTPAGGPFAKVRPFAVLGMSAVGLLIFFVRGRRLARRRKLYEAGRSRRSA